VHVLIDLDAHFRNSRMHLLAFAPAPLQILYPFFVGTAGASYLPLAFSDQVVTPPEYAPFFSEKLLFLPGTYYVNSHQASLPPPPPPPPPPPHSRSLFLIAGSAKGGSFRLRTLSLSLLLLIRSPSFLERDERRVVQDNLVGRHRLPGLLGRPHNLSCQQTVAVERV